MHVSLGRRSSQGKPCLTLRRLLFSCSVKSFAFSVIAIALQVEILFQLTCIEFTLKL